MYDLSELWADASAFTGRISLSGNLARGLGRGNLSHRRPTSSM